MSQLKLTLALAEYGFSKKTMTQKIQSFWKSSSDTNSHSARSEHVHAELVHAEATLIRGLFVLFRIFFYFIDMI